jgi:hypothetical protein
LAFAIRGPCRRRQTDAGRLARRNIQHHERRPVWIADVTPIEPAAVGILGLHAIRTGRLRSTAVSGASHDVRGPDHDHRIVDSEDAVRFLVRIRDLIEDPSALLLSM